MRLSLIAILAATACTDATNHLGNPLSLPLGAVSTTINTAADNTRRGQVEVFVKANHTSLLADIDAGGGPALTQAMDIAGIAVRDRPARVIQLQSDRAIYQTAPGALVTALMVYSR